MVEVSQRLLWRLPETTLSQERDPRYLHGNDNTILVRNTREKIANRHRITITAHQEKSQTVKKISPETNTEITHVSTACEGGGGRGRAMRAGAREADNW